MNNRLKVFVRVRPLYDQRSIIDIIDDKSLVFDPLDSESDPTDGRQFKAISSKRNKNSQYSFDGVFDDRSTNYSIFETVTKPMVDATIDGYNCSVFAYGATGSGKTHTMLGKPSNPGVIYYMTKDLFEKLSIISDNDPLPAELKICYFEIYNEKIRDLLVFEPNNFIRCGNKRLRTTPERCRARTQGTAGRDAYNLAVCEAPGDGHSLVIPDLSLHTPENAEELIKLLEAGNANRSQHPTDANADSSRSHAIFQIILTRRTCNQTGSGYKLQSSKMSLIDLAGSERASVAYRPGNNRSKNLQREGGNINKSLLALGNCINALADPRGAGHKHIPYRNSKLTRLLEDSLGGKCRTAMIATVCQQQSHYDDTQNTLVYASRAKFIKTMAGRNFTDVAIQPKNYSIIIKNQAKQITTLQSENEKLREQIEKLEKVEKQPKPKPKSSSNFMASYGQQIAALYEERGNIKLDILHYESKYKLNELKLTFKELDESRQDNIKMNGLRTQLKFFEQERTILLGRVAENEEQINSVLAKMSTEFVVRGFGTIEEFDDMIGSFITEKERIQELQEKRICEQDVEKYGELVEPLKEVGRSRTDATRSISSQSSQASQRVAEAAAEKKPLEGLDGGSSAWLKKLLTADSFTNDQVIMEFLELLCTRDPAHISYIGPLFTTAPDISTENIPWETVKTLLVPMHIHDAHWFLIVVRLDAKMMHVYDSMSRQLQPVHRNGADIVRRILIEKGKLIEAESWVLMYLPSPQESGCNCGIHVMANADYLTRGIYEPGYDNRHINSFRIQIFDAIVNKQLPDRLFLMELHLPEFKLQADERLKRLADLTPSNSQCSSSSSDVVVLQHHVWQARNEPRSSHVPERERHDNAASAAKSRSATRSASSQDSSTGEAAVKQDRNKRYVDLVKGRFPSALIGSGLKLDLLGFPDIPGGFISKKPKLPFGGCPGCSKETNTVKAILNYETKYRLVFWVIFDDEKKSANWIDIEILRELEPKGVLIDFVRCIYLLHSKRWKGLVTKGLKYNWDPNTLLSEDLKNFKIRGIAESEKKYRVEKQKKKKNDEEKREQMQKDLF